MTNFISFCAMIVIDLCFYWTKDGLRSFIQRKDVCVTQHLSFFFFPLPNTSSIINAPNHFWVWASIPTFLSAGNAAPGISSIHSHTSVNNFLPCSFIIKTCSNLLIYSVTIAIIFCVFEKISLIILTWYVTLCLCT